MINIGLCLWLAAVVAACTGEPWTWPEADASVRIDTKVSFLDGNNHDKSQRHQSDEVPFVPASETSGFYNRPPGSGTYPVRVETHQQAYTQGKNNGQDGNVGFTQYCKCVSNPDCQYREDSRRKCAVGKYLCCYKRSNRFNPQNTEFFNEIEDERPMLFPSRENFAKPFPPPDTTGLDEDHPSVLVGPGIPGRESPGSLPSGVVGPTDHHGVLVGPGGPTGIIGPSNQNAVLVGPGGPTGLIGPRNPNGPRDIHPDETAQRGVLVGPGGPTGVVGPANYLGRRPVLVGPGGPTGSIGPRGYYGQGNGRQGFGRQAGPGVLVGPGGPTGVIGPGRQLLVGPKGPTGNIGPQGYYGK